MHLFKKLNGIVSKWLDECLVCESGTFPAQVLYPQMVDTAGQQIKAAIAKTMQANQGNAAQRIKAVVAPYNALGSTRNVNFTTGVRNNRPVAGQFYRVVIDTSADKSHVNRAVCDNNWEATFCRIIDNHPKVISYVKNHGLGLEVPYLMGSTPRTYVPDFIVRVDDGRGPEDPLNLIAEVKGFRREDAVAKANTMASYWVPGVNNLGCYGRWAFHEFKSVDQMQAELEAVINDGGTLLPNTVTQDAGIADPAGAQA